MATQGPHSLKKTVAKISCPWMRWPPTLGGNRFWTDQFHFRQFRIQKNVLTGCYRLLDGRNRLRRRGSYLSCRRALEEIRDTDQLADISERVLVLVHGLGRTAKSMEKLSGYFSDRGFLVVNFEYASTQGNLAEHAMAFHHVIQSLGSVPELYFVGHSMGNIVFRKYLMDHVSKTNDPPWKASVMLAPPSHGSYVARVLKPTLLFGLLLGRCALSLAGRGDQLSTELATPAHRFGIIAGKYNLNPLFRSDNDMVVSVSETRLLGAHDFKVLKGMHTTLMAQPAVSSMIDRFFEFGFFETEGLRCPLHSGD